MRSRTHRALAKSLAALGATTLLAASAHAQDVQNFEPAVGTWNYLSVEGAQVAPEGQLVPSLYLNYGHKPLIRRDANGDEIESLVDGLITADLLAAYSFTDRLEIGLAVPVNYVMGGDGLNNVPGASDGAALGDLRLVPKVRLLGDATAPFSLAFSLPVALPTGDPDKLTGDDTISVQPRVIAEVRFGAISAAANVGFKYRAKSARLQTLVVGNEVTYGAAVGMALNEDWRLMAEAFGAAAAEDVQDDARPLEALAGARWFASECAVVSAGAGVGVIGDYGTPDVRALAGFAWQCRFLDDDRDGIENKLDRCPDQPEDKDGFEDKDGCVDPDNDGDGLNDADDKCPERAEDKDGFEDEDGCPDTDNDADGVLDHQDTCPMEAEDKDGHQDEDGCPEPDNDNDGIKDAEDKCPNEPETVNDHEDTDGCPDTKPRVQVTAKKLEILERVYFQLAKAELDPRSFPLLDEVAQVLNANPRILKLRVEGHTDRSGKASKNLELSRARAKAVKSYLVEKGVDAGRLLTEGYGSTKPLDEADTPEAAAKNRRVEFVILETAP